MVHFHFQNEYSSFQSSNIRNAIWRARKPWFLLHQIYFEEKISLDIASINVETK